MTKPIKREGTKRIGVVPGDYERMVVHEGRVYIETAESAYLVTPNGLAPILRPDYTKPTGLN